MENTPEFTRERYNELLPQFEEITLKQVADTLSHTIKFDDDNKIITLLCMLSAYTDSSQVNISFNAPSSTGKSYTAIQVAELFPNEDKIELSGASPTAFYHGEGVYDKERKAKLVSLERKILLLYEQPDPMLQAKLRAVLSHDKRELQHRITNKKKGANQTELIIIRGFPATIFCSAGLRLDEQETTRAILLSPEVTQEKILAGIELEARRSANVREFEEWLESQPDRIALKDRILAIKQEYVNDIIVPGEYELIRRFNKKFKKAKSRHMRDMNHLMNLIKATALLNLWNRRRPDGEIRANQSDIDQVLDIWSRLIESQELSVPPSVLHTYTKYILPAFDEKFCDYRHKDAMEKRQIGLSRYELIQYYYKLEGTPLNEDQLRKQILPQLEAASILIQQKPDSGDRRSPHIFPIWYPADIENPLEPNNEGKGGGEEISLKNW